MTLINIVMRPLWREVELHERGVDDSPHVAVHMLQLPSFTGVAGKLLLYDYFSAAPYLNTYSGWVVLTADKSTSPSI